MADENNEEFRAELKDASERLFALLSKEKLSDEDKQQANAIVEKNPEILGWKDFTAKVALPDLMAEYKKNSNISVLVEKSAKSLQTTKLVLDNLQQMKKEGLLASVDRPAAKVIDDGWAPNGETIATQTFKNINFLDVLGKTSGAKENEKEMIAGHGNKEYMAFLHQIYEGENKYGANPNRRNIKGQKAKDILKSIVTDRQLRQIEDIQQRQKTLTIDGQKEERKTFTLEDLDAKAYLGTLTVEEAEQRRKLMDEKKVADMKNQDGDQNKHKREPSNDKFRDEDVIKYMYEDWVLGGASWLFNKVENYILNTVDSACDMYTDRSKERRRKKDEIKDENLKAAQTRADKFLEMAGNMMNGLGAECQTKLNSYNSLMQELKDNLNNPNPNWQHFSPDDPFIKNLEANPAQAQKFIEETSEELKNRTKMIEATGKLAMQIASTQMTDEFMRNQGAWDKAFGEPMDDAQLQAMFAQKYQETQKNILKALAVMAEDNRLVSEAIYNTMPEPKPDLQTFTQQRMAEQQNNFLDSLSKQSKTAAELQNKELGEYHFGGKVSSKVVKAVRGINKEIEAKVQGGNLYDAKIFEEEHSKERIEAKTSLYEEAMKENSPQSRQKMLEYTQTLNGYQQKTLESRRIDAANRRNQVDKFVEKINARDKNRKYQSNNRGNGNDGR